MIPGKIPEHIKAGLQAQGAFLRTLTAPAGMEDSVSDLESIVTAEGVDTFWHMSDVELAVAAKTKGIWMHFVTGAGTQPPASLSVTCPFDDKEWDTIITGLLNGNVDAVMKDEFQSSLMEMQGSLCGLLSAAISVLLTTTYRDSTPQQAIQILRELAGKM